MAPSALADYSGCTDAARQQLPPTATGAVQAQRDHDRDDRADAAAASGSSARASSDQCHASTAATSFNANTRQYSRLGGVGAAFKKKRKRKRDDAATLLEPWGDRIHEAESALSLKLEARGAHQSFRPLACSGICVRACCAMTDTRSTTPNPIPMHKKNKVYEALSAEQ